MVGTQTASEKEVRQVGWRQTVKDCGPQAPRLDGISCRSWEALVGAGVLTCFCASFLLRDACRMRHPHRLQLGC